MIQRITKAEVLLTRRCNIACATCEVIHPDLTARELSTAQWQQAFDIVYDQLGATFIALYGGEPLELGEEKLLEIVKHLVKWRSEDRGFTIISNGIKLSRRYAEELVAAGLDSWTSSVDTAEVAFRTHVGDVSMAAKVTGGLRALGWFKELGIRDTCGIVTVTARNLAQIIPTVKWLTAHGHWAGIDLLHYQRGDGQYSFSSTPEQMEKFGLMLKPEHLPQLTEIADWLIAHHEELLVFPTKHVLEMWKDPAYSIDLTWKCSPAHALTIDSDGSIGLCDDRMPTHWDGERTAEPWSIFDLADRGVWDEFVAWYAKDLEHCKGCFWSTHVMAVDALNDDRLRRHYIHRVTPAELS